MANEIRTIFYIFVILSYFVRQGDPFGEQNTNARHLCPKVVFCSPHYWSKSTRALGLRPDDMTKYSLANKIRMISEHLIFLAFFDRHTGAWATILRMESETYPPSAHLRFFVRFLCALRAPWRLNGEWNTNNFLYLRNTVVFCSPGRPIWRTKYECGALSPRSCFLFAIQAPWRLKYEWKNTVAQWSFLVRISSACLRMRISFGATTLRIPPEWYLRTRPEGVTHSPRRSYAFAPNDLRIRPEGVTHSPRRCYAFAPKVLRIRLGEQNTTIRVTRVVMIFSTILFWA